MSEVGVEKIEKLAEVIADAIILGKKVNADGKIDAADLQHAGQAFKLVQDIIDLALNHKEALEQIKDIQMEEALALLAKGYELVKKVEEVK